LALNVHGRAAEVRLYLKHFSKIQSQKFALLIIEEKLQKKEIESLATSLTTLYQFFFFHFLFISFFIWKIFIQHTFVDVVYILLSFMVEDLGKYLIQTHNHIKNFQSLNFVFPFLKKKKKI